MASDVTPLTAPPTVSAPLVLILVAPLSAPLIPSVLTPLTAPPTVSAPLVVILGAPESAPVIPSVLTPLTAGPSIVTPSTMTDPLVDEMVSDVAPLCVMVAPAADIVVEVPDLERGEVVLEDLDSGW
jgi:hypothetical protein